MPLSIKAEKNKDDYLNAINHLLYRAKRGESGMQEYKPSILSEANIYYTIYTHIGETFDWYKEGYVIDIDTKTMKAVGARYFIAEGKDTYTEVELSNKQFHDLVKYYKINELDLLDICCKKIKA